MALVVSREHIVARLRILRAARGFSPLSSDKSPQPSPASVQETPHFPAKVQTRGSARSRALFRVGDQNAKATPLAEVCHCRQFSSAAAAALDTGPAAVVDRGARVRARCNNAPAFQPKVDPNRSNCADSSDNAVFRIGRGYNHGAIATIVVQSGYHPAWF